MRPTSESVGRYRFMAMPRRRLRRRKGEGSPIEAGKLELNPQTVQLKPLINDVISTAGQLAEQNKNRLVVDAQENLGALTVDPMRLRQILLNLLSNACKFTKEGEVRLRARRVTNGRDWISSFRTTAMSSNIASRAWTNRMSV